MRIGYYLYICECVYRIHVLYTHSIRSFGMSDRRFWNATAGGIHNIIIIHKRDRGVNLLVICPACVRVGTHKCARVWVPMWMCTRSIYIVYIGI